MKRNKNLIELSRDHHHGLLLGWKIKQGFKKHIPLEELAKYVVHFANNALLPHFEEEETLVLVYLNPDDSFRTRTIDEHQAIKDLINNIGFTELLSENLLLSLTVMLEEHIRFEERELFPYMESILSAEQLQEIGELIENVHKPYIETYPNEFWAR